MNRRLKTILTIVSLSIVVLSYFLLQPHISNIIPFIREYRLLAFINNSIRNNHISPQEFWQLREFYSQGVIIVNKPQITFTSNKISSIETLINNIESHQSLIPEVRGQILYKNTNELIVKTERETLIYFIKPISEMAQANGFYDYKDKDKKMLENKNWYVITRIQK